MSYLSRRLPCRLGNRFARPIPASITTSITTPTARAAQAARKAPIPVERLASVYLFSTNHALRKDQYEEQARKLNQKGLDQQEQEIRVKENQLRRPWHRQDVDKPPAEKGPLEDMPTKGTLCLHHAAKLHSRTNALIRFLARQTLDHPYATSQINRATTYPCRERPRQQ